MNPIDPNAALVSGQQYTLSMSVSGLGVLENQSVDSITQQLEQSGAVDLATAIQTNSSLLHPLTYDVTFTYTGDGTDAAMDVFQEFANALNGPISTWNFISVASGAAPGTGTGGGVPKLPPGALPSISSSLWAVALIAIIAVFFFSGGASLIRRVAA